MLKIKNYIFLSMLLGFCFVEAQTKAEKETIIKSSNVEELNQLTNQFNLEFELRKKRIEKYLEFNNTPKKTIVDGVEKEIYDVDELGNVSYLETANLGSSVTINANKLYNGGSLGLNVQGQGMTAAVWDGGPALETHVEFTNSRVNIFDFVNYSNHGTHVMGTLLANGTNSNARGIAFQANGKAYDWNNDLSEMSNEASLGLLVSNHSYIISSSGAWTYGAYDSRAKQIDEICYAAPFYLPVTSAGNDRNSNENTVVSTQNQTKFGFDLVRGMHNAKNSLTVGAVNNVASYVNENSVQMSNFSSWGPSDDGRIKPEVVSKGVGVFSSIANSNSSYDTYQGTSMASPAVSGACLLLQQHYNNVNSSYMRSSTLKGLLMHTAQEAGFYDGPDYKFGWGLVDVSKAASVISQKSLGTSIIDELVLNNNSTYTRTFLVANPSDLKVSICWTDPASNSFNTSTVDPNVSYLVNDLDLKLTKNNVDYFPWSLNKNYPNYDDAPTNIGTNNVDIFERVDVDNAVGTYTLTVSHKGNIGTNGQTFSLILSGANLVLGNENFKESSFNIYPNPTNNILNVMLDEKLNGSTDLTYQVFDISGKVILNNKLINNTIDVSGLQNGMYFVKLTQNNESIIKKFIKN